MSLPGATLRQVVYDLMTIFKQTYDDSDITPFQMAYWVITHADRLRKQHIEKRDSGEYLAMFDVPTSLDGDGLYYIELPERIYDMDKDRAIKFISYQQSDGIYNDWVLPSIGELEQMMINLLDHGVGGFDRDNDYYWSSSEASGFDTVYANVRAVQTIEPTTADSLGYNWILQTTNKNNENLVRPMRTFQADEGAYVLRDRGPAGGWIFYIDGNTYYEAAPEDLPSVAWSNNDTTYVTGTSTAIGTGEANTALIIAQDGHTASAAQDCVDLSITNNPETTPRYIRHMFSRVAAEDTPRLYYREEEIPSPTNPYFFRVGDVVKLLGVEELWYPPTSVEVGLITTLNPALLTLDLDQPFDFPQDLLPVLQRQVLDIGLLALQTPRDLNNDGTGEAAGRAPQKKLTSVQDFSPESSDAGQNR